MMKMVVDGLFDTNAPQIGHVTLFPSHLIAQMDGYFISLVGQMVLLKELKLSDQFLTITID